MVIKDLRVKYRVIKYTVTKEIFARKLAKYRGIPFDNRVIPYFPNGEGNRKIKELLLSGKPAMITRYGNTEIEAIDTFLFNSFCYDRDDMISALCNSSGFFPKDKKLMPRFVDLYRQSAGHIDILVIWNSLSGLTAEEKLIKKWSNSAILTNFAALESWSFHEPWTEYLQNKNVLVIHPFEKSITMQYRNNREKLFANPKVLPEFKSLQIIKPTQGVGMSSTDGFATWFDAYDAICRKIDAAEFDIALIGAGAYGMPLAAYIKNRGKQAIHIGGGTQLLFGIKGKRWESPEAGYQYKLYNEHWKRPEPEEMPRNPYCDQNTAPYW